MTDAHDRRSPRHPDEDELVRAVDASAALRQLLAAASAPPSTAELKGRSQAIADFRAAHRLRSSEPESGAISQAGAGHRGTARLTRAGRWSSARLTVACAAILALLGSTAATAAAGELPMALRNAMSGLFTDPAPARDRPSPTGASSEHPLQPGPGRTAPSASPTGSPASPSSTGSSSGAAGRRQAGATAHQLAALCRAYPAGQAGVSPAEVLARPGFGPLITAAGGGPGVAALCAVSVGAAPRTAGPSAATSTGRPIAHPPPAATGAASARPTPHLPPAWASRLRSEKRAASSKVAQNSAGLCPAPRAEPGPPA